jgi:cytochrome c-type biogenesis protein CcmF
LLTFFGIVAATGIGLVAWRGDKLRAPGRIDSAVSRESAFLANNLLFAALAFVVLLGTVFPLIAEALRGTQLSVGEPYFDRMATPIGLALLFLMAAAPALPWRATSGEVVRNRLLVPAWIGGVTMLAAVILGARGLAEILAYGLGAFATAGIVRQFVLGIRGRRRALGESRAVALGRATRSNPRLYGGLVVHFGVVLIAVVLAASSAYGANRDVKLTKGQSATISGYTVTYLGAHTAVSDQKTTVSADVKVRKGDRVLGTYAPAISTYPNSTEGIGTPSVHTGVVDDVYLTLVSSPNAQREITLGVRINTLIVWLWIGGAFMALGTVLALAPRLRRRHRSVPSEAVAPAPVADPDTREPDAREEVPV